MKPLATVIAIKKSASMFLQMLQVNLHIIHQIDRNTFLSYFGN